MSFFDSLVLLFSGGDEAAVKNKRALKQIVRDLNQNKYRKLYAVKAESLTPAAGMFFYDMYKMIATAQAFMKNAEKSTMLKQITVESFIDGELKKIYDQLTPEAIEKQRKHLGYQELTQQIQNDLKSFSEGLEYKASTIDHCYSLIMAFGMFVSFDFFSFLKKIDPRIKEYQFSSTPQYRNVDGEYVVEHLKDFLELPHLDATSEEWRTVFDILKKYRSGKNIIDPNQWKKLISSLQDIRRSGMLTFMVRHITQDPSWQSAPRTVNEYIVDSYIKTKKAEIQECLKHIMQDSRIAKREGMIKKLFGSMDITRLQYYTNTGNEVFLAKNLDGFTHVQEMNYLKGFLTDHPELQELCDLFLISGQWSSSEAARRLSQDLHKLTDIIEQVSDFDEALGDNGVHGSKLKIYLKKSGLDKSQLANMKLTLNLINAKAQELIDQGLTTFTQVGSYFNDLREDHKQDKDELLVNWKEIESLSKTAPITKRLEQGCTMLEQFVHLLRLFKEET